MSGGERPWPYDVEPRPDGPGLRLAPIPERAEAIRQAAADLIEGSVSVSGVARRWTESGLLPKSGGSWAPSSVANLLRNPTLFGAVVYRGQPIRDESGSIRVFEHAILDRPTWLRLQEAISGDGRPSLGLSPSLLAGIASCGSCGAPLAHWRVSTRPESAHRYRCQNRECPRPVQVSLPLLDEYVSDAFRKIGRRLPAVTRHTSQAGPDPDVVLALEADLLDVTDALEATDDEDEALTLLRRRKTLRADLARLQDTVGDPEVIETPLDVTAAEHFDRVNTSERRSMLADALAEVTISPGTPGRKGLDTSRVSIRWTP